MRAYLHSEFDARSGRDFTLDGVEGGTFRLSRVVKLTHSNREGGGFRIEFEGPSEPLLPQAIYTIREGGEAFELFLVAVARSPGGGVTYEAVFN